MRNASKTDCLMGKNPKYFKEDFYYGRKRSNKKT